MSESVPPAWPEIPALLSEALSAAVAADDEVAVLSHTRELMAIIRERVSIAWIGDDETLTMINELDTAAAELIAHRQTARSL